MDVNQLLIEKVRNEIHQDLILVREYQIIIKDAKTNAKKQLFERKLTKLRNNLLKKLSKAALLEQRGKESV